MKRANNPRVSGSRRHWTRTSPYVSKRERYRRPDYGRRRLIVAGITLAMLIAIVFGALFSMNGGTAQGAAPGVRVINIQGVIDSTVSDFVIRSIDAAQGDGTGTVVLVLDTPGGLDQPMRDIIQKMTTSPLPVVCYVSPSGARAASAGTFIMMASDVAAMSPGTNLGAAHPVAIGADPSTDEGIKITNDAAAYMMSLAEANGRNAQWADMAVRQSMSLSADQALEEQVIEFKADNLDSLLSQINGFTTKAKGIKLDTAGASVSEAGMNFRDSILHLLLNPNIAYVLLIFGLLALLYEFVHPGIGIGAISGVIALVLSLYALYQLPVNYTGLALIVFGVILLVIDLYVTSHGILSAGGIISIIIGSFFLFDSSAPFLRVAWPVNLALAAIAAAFFLVVARKVMKARRMPAQTGQKAMIGEVGHTRSQLDPLGQVFVHGEIWSAEAPEGETIEKGEEIVVTDVQGLMLKVKKTV